MLWQEVERRDQHHGFHPPKGIRFFQTDLESLLLHTKVMATPPPPPDALAFSPDGELFAVVADRQVQVWSTTGGQKIAEWSDPVAAQDDSYSCIACSSVQKKKKDGSLIVVAVGTANGEVLALDSTGVVWRSASHTG